MAEISLPGPIMRLGAPPPAASPAAVGFQPLAPLLRSIQPEKLDAARLRVAELDRTKLIDGYQAAFTNGRRVAAFVLADELTKRGIPPCFRLDYRAAPPATLEQKFDLFLGDVRWLRREYPDHAKIVRYQRCRTLLAGTETPFHREAEYAFYGGRRPAWKLVASLSLEQRQQWDCAWLRSAPLKKRDAETQAMQEQVFKALRDDLRTVRRTVAFTDADADATLKRRHALWLCSHMASGASPTETAARYEQMTGERITRQAVAKQLEKISKILKTNGMKAR